MQLYGVIGDEGVLGSLRHPTMHPMQRLRRGLGLCHVRTQVALDEPRAPLHDVPLLTESVLGYVEVVSRDTPVIYVVAEAGDEAACGWRAGRLELGPVRSAPGDPPARHGLLRRVEEPGAINAGLRWLGVGRERGADRATVVGLAERERWEPT